AADPGRTTPGARNATPDGERPGRGIEAAAPDVPPAGPHPRGAGRNHPETPDHHPRLRGPGGRCPEGGPEGPRRDGRRPARTATPVAPGVTGHKGGIYRYPTRARCGEMNSPVGRECWHE